MDSVSPFDHALDIPDTPDGVWRTTVDEFFHRCTRTGLCPAFTRSIFDNWSKNCGFPVSSGGVVRLDRAFAWAFQCVLPPLAPDSADLHLDIKYATDDDGKRLGAELCRLSDLPELVNKCGMGVVLDNELVTRFASQPAWQADAVTKISVTPCVRPYHAMALLLDTLVIDRTLPISPNYEPTIRQPRGEDAPALVVDVADEAPFTPFKGGQTDFFNDTTADILYFEGGWYAGKTFAGAHKLAIVHIANAISPHTNSLTGVPSLVVGPTYDNIVKVNVDAVVDAFAAFGLEADYKTSRMVNGKKLNNAIIVPALSTPSRPSIVYFLTAERPELITGFEVGAAWGDEVTRWPSSVNDPKRDPLTQIQGRVRHPDANRHIQIYTYTNEGNATRVFAEARSGKPGTARYRGSSRANTRTPGFVDRLLVNLPEEMHGQYIDGDAMSVTNASVYPAFNDDTHIVSGMAIDWASPVHFMVDFNISPGMHILIGQRSPGGEFRVYREVHSPGLTAEKAMRQAISWVRSVNDGTKWTASVYPDPAGKMRETGSGRTQIAWLEAVCQDESVPYEVYFKARSPLVVDRIQAVNLALSGLHGTPRLFVDPKCKELVTDLREARYDERGRLEEKDMRRGHSAAAIGYWVEYLAPLRSVVERTHDVKIVHGPRTI